jgi:hypothetical protein
VPAEFSDAATSAFVAAFNDILLIGAIVLFAGSVFTFALVRARDFIGVQAGAPAGEAEPAAAAG